MADSKHLYSCIAKLQSLALNASFPASFNLSASLPGLEFTCICSEDRHSQENRCECRCAVPKRMGHRGTQGTQGMPRLMPCSC